MTNEDLRHEAGELRDILETWPVYRNAAEVVSQLVLEWEKASECYKAVNAKLAIVQAELADTRDASVESEQARLGAVKVANGLREQLATAKEHGTSGTKFLVRYGSGTAYTILNEAGAVIGSYKTIGSSAAHHAWALKEIARLREENERYCAELNLHYQKKTGEYWAWQGDEEDHLESLTCPVLIPAQMLREQLAARRDDLAEALIAYCASIRDCVDFRIYNNYAWRLVKTLIPSSDDVVGDDIRTAAAKIRAAIAPQPKPPTKQEVAEALAGIRESYSKGVDDPRMDEWFRRLDEFVVATPTAGKDGEE